MTSTQTYPAAAAFAQLLDYRNRHDPYPYFAELAEEPIRQLDEHRWIVTRHEDITALLRDPRLSNQDPLPADPDRLLGSDGKPFRGPFLALDPPHHDVLRTQTMHQFVPRILGLRPRIEALVEELLDQHRDAGSGQFDVVESLAYPLPVGVICALLGVPRSEEPVFHSFASRLTRALDPIETLSEQEIADLEVTGVEWRDYLMTMIGQRVANPGDDLISGLLTDGDPDSRMNAIELGSTLGLLLIAGHETTVNLIANGTLALLRNPDALDRLRADPDLAPSVLEEVLRYDPPVQMNSRTATADILVAGKIIPAGDRIQLLLAAGNRDPRRFVDPQRFWPERPNNAHLSFGGGVHYCLGAALARMEGQAALSALARRLVNPRLSVDPPVYRENMLLRGPEALWVGYDAVLG